MNITIENLEEAFAFFGIFQNEEILSYLPLVIGMCGFIVIVGLLNLIFAAFRKVKEYMTDGVVVRVDGIHKSKDIQSLLQELHRIGYLKARSRRHFSFEVVLKKDRTYFFLVVPKVMSTQIFTLLKSQSIQYEVVPDTMAEFLEKVKSKGMYLTAELSKDYVWPLEFDRTHSSYRKSLSHGDFLYVQILLRPIHNRWLKGVEDVRTAYLENKDPFASRFGKILRRRPNSEERAFTNEEKISVITKKISTIGFECFIRGVLFSQSKETQLLSEYLQEVFKVSSPLANELYFEFKDTRLGGGERADLLTRYLSKDIIDITNDVELASLVEYLYN